MSQAIAMQHFAGPQHREIEEPALVAGEDLSRREGEYAGGDETDEAGPARDLVVIVDPEEIYRVGLTRTLTGLVDGVVQRAVESYPSVEAVPSASLDRVAVLVLGEAWVEAMVALKRREFHRSELLLVVAPARDRDMACLHAVAFFDRGGGGTGLRSAARQIARGMPLVASMPDSIAGSARTKRASASPAAQQQAAVILAAYLQTGGTTKELLRHLRRSGRAAGIDLAEIDAALTSGMRAFDVPSREQMRERLLQAVTAGPAFMELTGTLLAAARARRDSIEKTRARLQALHGGSPSYEPEERVTG